MLQTRVEQLERRLQLAAVPLGGEFALNTYTTNFQVAVRVATAPDGGFVATWASTGQDGSGEGIYARRFDASGSPLGSEFLVNTFTTGNQALPAIAMDEAGDFVIVWHSQGQDGSGRGVYGQLFSSSGATVGGEFRANVFTTGEQAYPTVAMDADGDFVVAWESAAQDGNLLGVYARRYDSGGAVLGSEFLVNDTTAGDQASTTVAMDDAGNFVIAWGTSQDGTYDIYAKRYNTSGGALGTEFLVNTTLARTQYFPWAAMDADGDFVIAWQSDLQDTSGYGIYAQRYSSAGAPQGAEFRVNTFVPFNQDFVYVSMNDSGNFIVVWESYNQDVPETYGVYAQAYSANGNAIGSEFRVNTQTVEDQSFPSVALADNGKFVVAWQSRLQDGSQFGVYAQRYDLDQIPPTVVQSSFNYATSPHTLTFTFSEDVSASLTGADVTVTPLPSGAGIPMTLLNYNAGTNTATFSFPTAILADGRYRATLNVAGITDAGGNPLVAPPAPFDFLFMLGDADNDGDVDLDDFNRLASNFNGSPRDFTQGDFTYNSVVDLDDFNILASRFNTSLGAALFGKSSITVVKRSRVVDALRDALLA